VTLCCDWALVWSRGGEQQQEQVGSREEEGGKARQKPKVTDCPVANQEPPCGELALEKLI